MTQVSVLFVDLGNICRAPIAEILFLHLIRQRGWSDRFVVDSCGTGDFHVGKPPDPRALKVLTRHGISITNYNHIARQLQSADLTRFDYILCMDQLILGQVRQLATGSTSFSRPPSSGTGSINSPTGKGTMSPVIQTPPQSKTLVNSTTIDQSIVTHLNQIVTESLNNERAQIEASRCTINLLGDYYYKKQLSLNQKVDSKDFLVSDPFYNPSEEPFERVYEKCFQYIEAFLDTFISRISTVTN